MVRQIDNPQQIADAFFERPSPFYYPQEIPDQLKKEWVDRISQLDLNERQFRRLFVLARNMFENPKAYPTVDSLQQALIYLYREAKIKKQQDIDYEPIRQEQLRNTRQILEKYFPDVDFEIFNEDGSGGLIYKGTIRNKPSEFHLYKISRESLDEFDYELREKENLIKLMPLTPTFEAHVIREGYSIIIMEWIDAVDLRGANLSLERRQREAQSIFQLLLEKRLWPGDVEFVYDKKHDRIRLIDCGGFANLEECPRKPGETYEQVLKKAVNDYLRL